MRSSAIFLAAALMAACVFVPALEPSVMALGKSAEAPRITIEELRSLLGGPDVVILDVRVGDEWKKSNEKIQGAVREEPEKYNQWAVKYPKEKTLVFY
jgi:hypothetical protein